MENLRETIMEHIKNKELLNPTQVSILEDRLSHIVSQFHTPDHPPYAAMIHRAIAELKQKGGSTEKSISEFIQREYDDLPWSHCSLLKHHLGLLSKHGEINESRGFRYSVCGAGSSKGSIKGGKKNRRKKLRWKFDRKRTKKLKLVIRVNDQNSEVTGNDVSETEKGQNGGLQTPKQDGTDGTVPFQLTDEQEDEAMDIDPPLLVSTDEPENQVELNKWNSNEDEDAIPELSSPERPPGFEFMGVEVSTLPSENNEQRGEALPSPVTEELEKADLPCSLQPIQEKKQEKKKGKYPEGRQLDIMLEQHEIVLALPRSQMVSPMQNDRSQRQLRRWSGDLPDVSHTVNVLSSSENSGKCPPVELTSNVEKTQVLKKIPSKFTIITRRKAKVNSSPKQSGARPQRISLPLCPSMDSQQDEGSNSLGVRHSTRQDDDTPLKKYQRRGRRLKPTMLQDESPLADFQKQQVDESPKLHCYPILLEKTLEASLTKEDSEKDHQLEPSKPRVRGRHLKRTLDVDVGKNDKSSTRIKLKRFSHHRARKIQKKS